MQVTLKELLAGREGIGKLRNAEFPIKKTYEMRKMFLKIDEEIKLIIETNKSILKKFTDENEKINNVEADKEWLEFLDTEIDIEIEKIHINEISNVKMSVNDITNLTYLLDGIEEEPEKTE